MQRQVTELKTEIERQQEEYNQLQENLEATKHKLKAALKEVSNMRAALRAKGPSPLPARAAGSQQTHASKVNIYGVGESQKEKEVALMCLIEKHILTAVLVFCCYDCLLSLPQVKQ